MPRSRSHRKGGMPPVTPPKRGPAPDMPQSWTVPLIGMGLVLMMLGALALGIWWLTAPGGAANASDPVQVALGERVYKEQCASCHGAQLEGQPNWRERRADGRLPAPPHDATGHTWHHPDGVLFRITKYGPAAYGGPGYPSDMPGFDEALSDQEIWAVLAFIKSRWPEDIRDRQERMPATKR